LIIISRWKETVSPNFGINLSNHMATHPRRQHAQCIMSATNCRHLVHVVPTAILLQHFYDCKDISIRH
jgi:hypothetical protein